MEGSLQQFARMGFYAALALAGGHGATAAAQEQDWNKVIEAAKKEGSVTVYHAQLGAKHWKDVVADFEKRYGNKYYVVHRSDLHRLLSEAVPASDISVSKRCAAVETRNGTVGLSFADGSGGVIKGIVGGLGATSGVFAGSDDLGADAALVDQGKTYFNIHTSDFPGGEIRGQLGAP